MRLKYFFFCLLCTTLTSIYAQDNCYNSLRQKGIDAYNNGECQKAILKWDGALDCPDVPNNHDLYTWKQKANECLNPPPPPDTDGDGYLDKNDRCPSSRSNCCGGCPDTDGDNIPDIDDNCDNERGPASNNGCPPPPPATFIQMVSVPGGTFKMGCTNEQGSDCTSDEKPAHSVTLSSYKIGKYEVTQKQWRDIMGSDPSELAFPGCDNCPVERVSWDDIQGFLTKLNAKYPGSNYRLPTEAEWEYAARGGKSSQGYKYAGSNTIDDVAWYSSNSGSKIHPVGGKQANELGIYDMSGNVWEWCSDWYGDYSSGSVTNPKGASTGSFRVLRGGSWDYNINYCRVSYRDFDIPSGRYFYDGFRLVQGQ